MQTQSADDGRAGPSARRQFINTEPPASFTSVSGFSTTSQILAIQADYAAKVATMERAAIERERAVMEKERIALELQTQAQIAAIQDTRSIRSSSRLSKKDISEWLDKAFDSNITSRNVDFLESPPNVTDAGLPLTSVNVEHSATVQKGSDYVHSTRAAIPTVSVTTNPTYVGGARPMQPLPCTTTQNNVYQSTNTCNKSNYNSFNDNAGDNRLQDNSSHTNIKPTSSDIALLAQAITSLASGVQAKSKVGDGRLPFFDGKPIDFLGFKRAFDNTRHAYTPSDNITRIGMALKGAARDAVAVLLMSARDPHELLTALEMRFGRPELIVLQEIASVRSLPKLLNDGSDLHKFACRVRNCVEVIKLLEEHSYLESPELFQSILLKLTPLLRTRWTDFGAIHFTPRQGKTKLELLATFLAHEVDLQIKFGLLTEPVIATKKVDRVHIANLVTPSNPVPNKNKSENRKIICTFCKENHFVDECDKFISLTLNDRWQFVKENKLCHKCLKKGSHSYKFCKNSKEICTENNCFRRHHKLLHGAVSLVTCTNENQTKGETSSSGIPETTEVCSGERSADFVAHADSRRTLRDRPLLKIIAVTVSGPKGTVNTHALLDDGSSSTFIDSEISALIGASGPKSVIQVNCVGGLSKSMEVEYVDFNIKGRYDTTLHKISKARAVSGLNITPQTLSFSDTVHFEDLRDHLCLSYENVKPMVLLGIDNWHLTIPQKVRKGVSNCQPVACLTALGWVVFGFTNSRTKTIGFVNDSVNHGVVAESLDSFIELENIIRDYYKLDSIGITKRSVQSSADVRAVTILENTTRRLPDGQFETGLLWCNDDLVVPDNYSLALSRLLSLEKKFIKDEAYAKKYRENIHAMIDKGYAELCDRQSSTTGVTWYLPHFGVTNPNKPGKLRVVHDAAAKCQGVSLNTLLLTGPDLLQSLLGILIRFREGKIGLTGDIKEMFPQIKIREADRDAQRFLWRDSLDLPISTFRMSSMIFGAASSPFTALYLKNKNALEYEALFPEAVQGIIHNTYMDDFIASVNSVEEATQLAKDVVSIHSRAHFVIRNWASNEEAALLSIPSDLRLNNTTSVDLGQLPETVRTLGLIWNTKNDTLGLNSGNFESLPSKLSKRAALSNMMRVFDPLGILSPLTIRARIIFQKIWRSGIDWDEELPQHLRVQWEQWTFDIKSSLTLNISRWYLICPQPIEQELHVFCDASEDAYSTVAYWRFLYSDRNVQLAFIASRSRVAPLKPTSIPRLELQAALIAARLASSILDASRIKPVRRFYWTDSMNVLGWLRNDARRYKPFVAHRVGEIIELTDIIEWRWVSSDLNVADDATRLKQGPLSSVSRWITGPNFLLTSNWPIEPTNNSAPLELKPSLCVHLINDEDITRPLSADSRRFSSWLRLIRATARAHQYISLLRLKALQKKGISVDLSCRVDGNLATFLPRLAAESTNNRHNLNTINLPGTLSSDNLHEAEIHVLRQSQQDSFIEELKCIKNNQLVSRCSRLSKLPGFLDRSDLLRLSSRVAAVTGVEEDMRTPIILDGKHPTVRLLVLYYHRKAAHASTELVVNELRQRYWILSLRNTVRSVAYRCQVCRLRRASTITPLMGALPEVRMSHHQRAFSFVGLDYFGPIAVSIGRRREKRYVALYTCLTVRAVHFEVVFSLTTDAAIMALRRFIARRGTPREIISDNGTAFVGASRVLRTLYGDAISDFAACEMIKWKFLPPSAPFMAGATERLVKSAKIALKATLTSRSPSDEVLSTLLCEAEALINSRPLTHVACDPDYPEALTPNHFLLGGYSSGKPFPAVVEDRDICSRTGWRKALRLSDFFWQRWVKEYLPTLSPSRVRGQNTSWSIGDLVLVADGNLPRGSWPRGQITTLYPGKDGVTRVVDVATPAGVLRRPVRKIVRLPV